MNSRPHLFNLHGCILGTIVGDAIGLPYEALSRRRGVKLMGPPDRHRFFFGYGMMSDDGEHTCMVAQSLAEAGEDVDLFQQHLARRLRWWLLCIPAGVGGATLRATIKLWLGFGPQRSGVFSAGNGPAMRAAILGVAIENPEKLAKFVAASTRITHTDPKSFFGAMAVAIAAQSSVLVENGDQFVARLRSGLIGHRADELIELMQRTNVSVLRGETTLQFADSIGAARGISGYIYPTVAVAIHAWLTHRGDYAAAVQTAISCGGDHRYRRSHHRRDCRCRCGASRYSRRVEESAARISPIIEMDPPTVRASGY